MFKFIGKIVPYLPAVPVLLKGATYVLLGTGSIAQIAGNHEVANALFAICSALGLKQVGSEVAAQRAD